MNKSNNLFARLIVILFVLFNLSACIWEHGDEPRGFTLPNQGLSGPVNSVVLAPDGSGDVYLGGDFSTYNDTSSQGIIRLHSDSTVDDSFAVGSGFHGSVNVIVPTADGTGDIYVGGEFSHYNGSASNSIIRLHSDGTVNSYFAPGSGIQLYDMPVGIAATESTSYTESNYLRAGKVHTILPAADGSGDIYVGGWFDSYNGTASKGIVRLHSDGTVDSSFVMGSGFGLYVNTIALATDGSGDIYVGGSLYSYNGTVINGITRLHRDGRVDSRFAVGSGFRYRVSTIVPVTDGSGDIYVGGSFTSYNGIPINRIIRLHSDGAVDSSFAVGSGFDSSVSTIIPAVDGSGDIFVGGSFTGYNGIATKTIIRLHRDGAVDSNFTAGPGFDSNFVIPKITPTEDGSGDLYIAGNFKSYRGVVSPFIIRLSSSGSVSQAYAQNMGFNGGSVETIAKALDRTGDVYVGGSFTSYNGVASKHLIRLNSDGTVDKGFDVGSGFDRFVYTIAPALDGTGDIYVGGYFTLYNGEPSKHIIRLNADGTVDSQFAPALDSKCVASIIVPTIDGSGDIYVGSCISLNNDTVSFSIVRLHSDGSVDSNFSMGLGFDGSISTIVPADDDSGDIYVGGGFSGYNGTTSQKIIRLNSDGTVDSSFIVGIGFEQSTQVLPSFSLMYKEVPVVTEFGRVQTITPTGDGSGDIYVGGSFTSYNSTTSNNIIRLHRDGTADSRFATGSGFDGAVDVIVGAADHTGDIYVLGSFSTYNDATNHNIIRLHSNGKKDSNFAVGSGFRGRISSIAHASYGSGGVHVGGYFNSYQNATAWGIVALNPDGSIY